jgi:uncharacterized OsmC-like protein
MQEAKSSATLEYSVQAKWISAIESRAKCKKAELILDTALSGREDAFNPAELFLASVAACMLKGIERVAPILKFHFRGAAIHLHGVRLDKPPRMARIDYEITIDTDEPDRRIELLHDNIRKFGTISNTVASACPLEGVIRRNPSAKDGLSAE